MSDQPPSMLWIVQKYVGCWSAYGDDIPKTSFEFMGIFATEREAIAACRDQRCMIAPAVLGMLLPEETVTWPGAYYPLAGDHTDVPGRFDGDHDEAHHRTWVAGHWIDDESTQIQREPESERGPGPGIQMYDARRRMRWNGMRWVDDRELLQGGLPHD